MGIHDRDYYRREGPRYLDALSVSGSACKWLLIINIVIYVLQLATQRVTLLGMIPHNNMGIVTNLLMLDTERVLHGELWRLVSYAFVHAVPGRDGSNFWMHIFFNLLFLWWFGSDVETIYGTKEFVWFYLTSALVGGCAFEAWALLTHQGGPGLAVNTWPVRLGASGAVTAVMVVYACHFPTRMILVFFLLPVPIWLFVLFQVVRDAFAFLSDAQTGTAVQVHLAGAAFGFAYYKMQWRLSGLLSRLWAWRGQRAPPPRARVSRPADDLAEAVAVGAPPAAAPLIDEQLEAKVDAVLEKVAKTGQASLTDTEREILLRASEIYKRRRS
jgi:membrane associated rhomboid family serine protease